MSVPRSASMILVLTLALGALAMPAAAQAPELGQGWMPEFTMASRQILALAEATPEEKFSWRPAPGVRSIGEVYVHLAVGNLWLLSQTGVKVDLSRVPKAPEKAITSKADVLTWLREGFDAVKQAYPSADRQAKVTFLGRETTAEQVFLRILVHNHEHMGQAIAYSRMNGIVPPWSKQ